MGDSNKRFLVGDLVEVKQRDKGLRGSWYSAVVVEVLKGKRTVEYDELLLENEVDKLRETVVVGKASDGDRLMATLPHATTPRRPSKPIVRPLPPQAMQHVDSKTWTKGFIVECFTQDAWWECVLQEDVSAAVVEDGIPITSSKSRVSVYYPDEDEMKEEDVDKLRVGQEWDEETGLWTVRGWSQSQDHETTTPKKRGRGKVNSRVETVEASRPASVDGRNVRSKKGAESARKEPPSARTRRGAEPVSEKSKQPVVKDLPAVVDPNKVEVESDVDTNLVDDSTMDLMINQIVMDINGQAALDGVLSAVEMVAKQPDEVNPPAEMNGAQMDDLAKKKFLRDLKWTIKKNPSKKKGGPWYLRSPKYNGEEARTFFTLTEAVEYEYARRSSSLGNLAKSDAKTSKSQSPQSSLSPIPLTFRDSNVLQFSSPKGGNDNENCDPNGSSAHALSPQVASNKPDGSGPSSWAQSRQHGDNAAQIVPPLAESREFVDANDRREVDIVIVSSASETLVDPEQIGSVLHNPFGTITNVEETEGGFVLHLETHGFPKEQLKVFVDNGELIIEAKYDVNKEKDKFSAHCSGFVMSIVRIPPELNEQSIGAVLDGLNLSVTLSKI